MSETVTDLMDPARATALAVTLGHAWEEGQPLPPFFHHAYFWTVHPEAGLGRDGHPKLGGQNLIPDLWLPRRMWGGGRLEFHAPLYAGRPAERQSVMESIDEKEGRSGRLGLVTLRHEIRQDGQLCVTEWQDLIYREDYKPGAPAPEPVPSPDSAEEIRSRDFYSLTLMRYSALTMNGHRIHYDPDYAREVEGYPGVVVHGPLLAQLLMLMAPGPLKTFRYRAIAPLCLPASARICRLGNRFWVSGPGGGMCMEAEADYASSRA
ncbi:MAG: acyl dehydratase [Rhodobacteraceae bacterium]|nr:acyl dehydratase [Paracoccaceae bacterium]